MFKSPQALYLHVPFCHSICAYCDFTRAPIHPQLTQKWLQSLSKEISERVVNKKLKTIYLGGGTPTALTASDLDTLLCLLDDYAKEVEEYTIEVNPESLTEEKVKILKKHGVHRLSIGIQSTKGSLLQLMGRKHTFNQVVTWVKYLQSEGFNNISVDCMYSLPTQTKEDLLQTLQDLVSLHIQHVSLYSLTIEPHSRFGREGFCNLDEDTESSMYFFAVDYLRSQGFHQYEISSFAQVGFQSQHNQVYWHYEDYYGIGLGASGKENHKRYDNTTYFPDYFKGEWIKEMISLSIEDEMFEMVMMNLRLHQGLELKRFNCYFQQEFDVVFKRSVQSCLQKNWLEIENGFVRCTNLGYPILNTILQEFMD